YVRSGMPPLVRKLGKNDDEKSQMPIVLEGQATNFVVDENPAAMPKVQERLKNFNKLVETQKITKALAEEGQQLLHRMPKLEARQNLRKAYEKLADGTTTFAEFERERDKVLAS